MPVANMKAGIGFPPAEVYPPCVLDDNLSGLQVGQPAALRARGARPPPARGHVADILPKLGTLAADAAYVGHRGPPVLVLGVRPQALGLRGRKCYRLLRPNA